MCMALGRDTNVLLLAFSCLIKHAKTHTSKTALETCISLWPLNVVRNLDGLGSLHSEKP